MPWRIQGRFLDFIECDCRYRNPLQLEILWEMDSEGDYVNQCWHHKNTVWNDSGGFKMKKTRAFLLMLLLLLSCSACGRDNQPNEESGDSETEQQQPQDDNVQSDDSTDTLEKIELDGTPVRWDEFPMPTAETFGLTGEDAIIYNAIAQVYNPKVYADTFSQSPEDITDLSLPAFEIYEKSESENGDTIYYGVFYECDYYNLGSGLADLSNPVYSLVKGKSPAKLTIDAQGNFVDFEQTPESSNDPYGDIRQVCGPMTELADFLCGETETYSKEPHKVPDLDAESMVIQYLGYYFWQD